MAVQRCEAMPDQETISQYLERLELQRKRVQHLRRQQLLQGSSVSFGIVTELAEAQADIAHIKEWLRSQHIDVEDLPDDQSQAEQHTHRRQAILAALVAYLRRHKRPLLSALALTIFLSLLYATAAYALEAGPWATNIGLSIILGTGLLYLIPRLLFASIHFSDQSSQRRQYGVVARIVFYVLSLAAIAGVGIFLRDQTFLPGTILPALLRREDVRLYSAIALGVLALLCAFIAFSHKRPAKHQYSGPSRFPKLRPAALLILYLIPLLIMGWAGYYFWHPTTKVIIVLAQFEGNENEYHVTDSVYRRLRTAMQNYNDVVVKKIDEVITEKEGSDVAISIGKKYKAALIIWGSYNETATTAPVSVNLEILCPLKCKPELGSQVKGDWRAPDLKDLQTLKLQTDLSVELSYLSLFVVGMVRYTAEDWQGAITSFTDALNQTDRNIPALDRTVIYRRRADAYTNNNQYDLAKKDMNKILEIYPETAWVYNDISAIDISAENYPSAIENINHAIKLDASKAAYFANKGVIEFLNGDRDQSIKDLNHAVDLDINADVVYKQRGDIYSNLEKYDLAIKDYTKAIALKDDNWEYFANRASVYDHLNQYVSAIDDYTKAINLLPNYARLYYERALEYSKNLETDRAINDLNTAIDIDDKYSDAYNLRGKLYFDIGYTSRAMSDVNKAIDIDSYNATYYYNRAAVYFNLENYKSAIDDLTKAINYSANNAEYYYKRAYAYNNDGQITSAKADLHEVISRSNDEHLTQEAQKRLKELGEP